MENWTSAGPGPWPVVGSVEEMNRDTVTLVVPLVVFIGAVSVIGVLGNTFVLVIYSLRYPRCNFKYFVLILAGIDLVSCGLLMPLEIVTLVQWFVFPSAGLCKFKSALNAYTVTASASCLLLISIDRYRKVCRPHGRQIHPALALKLTAVVLTLSAIPAASDAVFWGFHTYQVEYKGTNVTARLCEKDDVHKDTIGPKLHTTVLYAGTNTIIMISTLILYVFIAKKLFCQAGPILTPEITISSPDGNSNQTSVFNFDRKISNANQQQSVSDIETGFSDSDVGQGSTGSASNDVIPEEGEDCDNNEHKAEKTVRLREPPSDRSPKLTVRISQEIQEIDCADRRTFLRIPEVKLRPKSTTSGPSPPISPYDWRRRRRRSTVRSLKGHVGTKLRRKTLIMFILTIIFFVTTMLYFTLISVMADSGHFVRDFTDTERVVWLFFLRLYFINSFINPLLYGFLDTRFRHKLWDMGIRVRWLAGSIKRNIGESIRRSDSGRTKHEVEMHATQPASRRRLKSSTTISD